MNVRDLLVDRSDDVFARRSRRLAGLTNDELGWEPAPHFPLGLGRPVSGRPSPPSEAPVAAPRSHGQLPDPPEPVGEDDRKPAAAATSD